MKPIGLVIAMAIIGFLVMPACQSRITETTTVTSTVSTTATTTEARVTTVTLAPVTKTITGAPTTVTRTMTTTQTTTGEPTTVTRTMTTTRTTTGAPTTFTRTMTMTQTATVPPVTQTQTVTTTAITTTTTTAIVPANANLSVHRSDVGGVTVVTVMGAGFDSNEVVDLELRAAANGEDVELESGIVCSASGTFVYDISPTLLEGVSTGTYTLEAIGRGGSVAVVALTVK